MAKRRKKKQDPISELIGLSIIAVFFIAFYMTNSLSASVTFAGIWFAVCLSGVLYYAKAKKDRLKHSGIFEIDKMDGRQFEYYLEELYKSQGYKVRVTKTAGDFGADLVIERDNKRIVTQAKRYSKNVGIEAVQQAQASIAHYNANEAWVVSNRHYTDAARKLASSNNVKLVDREMLIQMMLQLNSQGNQPKRIS